MRLPTRGWQTARGCAFFYISTYVHAYKCGKDRVFIFIVATFSCHFCELGNARFGERPPRGIIFRADSPKTNEATQLFA